MARNPVTKRKQFNLDVHVLNALETLVRDNGDSFDQVADVAFRDLLKKLGRPVSLREALQAASARNLPANDREPKRSRKKA